MIKGVAAVWLPVTDMQRAVAFYGDTLGLHVTEHDERLERDRRQRPADRAERQRVRVARAATAARSIAFQPDGELEHEVERLTGRRRGVLRTGSPSTPGAGSCRSRTPTATTSSCTRPRAERPAMAAVPVPAAPATAVRRAMVAGILLGIGLGGFVDGIVLHQILQWHGMLTSTRRLSPHDRPLAQGQHVLGRPLPHQHLAVRDRRPVRCFGGSAVRRVPGDVGGPAWSACCSPAGAPSTSSKGSSTTTSSPSTTSTPGRHSGRSTSGSSLLGRAAARRRTGARAPCRPGTRRDPVAGLRRGTSRAVAVPCRGPRADGTVGTPRPSG